MYWLKHPCSAAPILRTRCLLLRIESGYGWISLWTSNAGTTLQIVREPFIRGWFTKYHIADTQICCYWYLELQHLFAELFVRTVLINKCGNGTISRTSNLPVKSFIEHNGLTLLGELPMPSVFLQLLEVERVLEADQ